MRYYRTGTEVRHDLEELGLGGAGVTDHAHVDVATEGGAASSGLGHAAEQHEGDATLDLIVAVNGREEAVDDVAVDVLVLAHLVHLLPLLGGHLGPHLVRGLDLVAVRAELGLAAGADTTGKEGHPVVEVPHPEALQPPHPLGLLALVPVPGLGLGPGQVDSAHVRDHDESANKLTPGGNLCCKLYER